MSSSNSHSNKPSYFGDLLNYEFPSSSSSSSSSASFSPSSCRQSIVSTHKSQKAYSPVVIERAGSIFIKSGIPKVTPFPTVSGKDNTEICTYDEHSVSSLISPLNTTEQKIAESESHDKENNKTIDDFEDTTEQSNSEKRNIKPTHVEITADKELSEKELQNNKALKEEQPLPNNRERSSTDESHYDEELTTLKNTANLLKKRPSLKPIDSVKSSNLLVNPYFRRSLIRKYKNEVENDEILGNRVKSLNFVINNDDTENRDTLENITESKSNNRKGDNGLFENNARIGEIQQNKQVGNIVNKINYNQDETVGLLVEENTVESNTLTPLIDLEKTDNDKLKIPRRSSKRLRNSMKTQNSNFKDIIRMNSVHRKSKLNSSSMRSIQTLASEIRTSLHTQGTKSVDFSNLDKLLEELLELKTSSDEEDYDDIKKDSIHVKERKISEDASNLSFVAIKPFNISNKSISRRTSLRKSLSTVSVKVNNHIKSSSNATESSDELKSLPNFDEIDNNNGGVCELKRSNAIRRKSGIMAGLIILYEILKEFGRRCKRVFKISKNKVVSFGKKQNRSSRKASIKGKMISDPTLIDIHNKPQFKSHNLHKSTSKRTIPVSDTSKNKGSGDTSLKTLVPLSKTLSAIKSDDEPDSELNNSGDVEKDQLIVLWKHYLSKSIMNRIDMKMDISKIDHIERVQSIQGNYNKFQELLNEEDRELERIMDRYIASGSSTRSSSTVGTNGPLTVDDFSIDLLDKNMNDSQFTLGLGKTSGTVKTNATASTGWSTIETGDEELHSEYNGDVSSISTIEEESSNFNPSDSSSVSSLDNHYEDYSFMTADDDERNSLKDKESQMTKKASNGLIIVSGKNSINSGFKSSNIKSSFRITNLQSILAKNREENDQETTKVAEDIKRNVSEESYSSMGSSMFSYQASVIV